MEGRHRGDRGPNKPIVIDIPGEGLVTLVSIGDVARRIGRATSTLRSWVKKQVIPANYLRDDLDRRWFPEDYAEFLEDHVPTLRDESDNLDDFRDRLQSIFDESSVIRVSEELTQISE